MADLNVMVVKVLRVTALLLTLALLVGAGWAYRVFSIATGSSTPAQVVQAVQTARQPQLIFKRNPLTLLVIGKDYNHTRQGIAYSTNARADTILLVSLDWKRRTVAALSVPRDSFVTAPDGLSGKINATHARGGVKLLAGTLEELLGVRIDYHIVLKDTAVKNIVDAVGGVWVETLDAMRYTDSWGALNIDLPTGRQFVNGNNAVGFVRYRKSNPGAPGSLEEGDLRRSARQQQLIRSLGERVLAAENLVRLDRIVDVAFGEVETDLSRAQVIALGVRLGREALSGLRTATLPGIGGIEGGLYYIRLDRERSRAISAWLLNGDAVAGRRVTRVGVTNASARAGVARTAAGLLSRDGYSVVRTSSASSSVAGSRVEYAEAMFASQARAIAGRLGVTRLEKREGAFADEDVAVTLGADVSRAPLNPVR